MPRARAAPLTGPATAELAFAKVNLTLRVLGRRRDGHHDLESLVCFAAVADRVTFRPGPSLELAARGPTASDAGPSADNAVMKAARALAERVAGLTLGRFDLVKRLPAGAGFGGGSADAGAALRLLARANRLDPRDPRLFEAARATGADVPVCLDPQPRWIGGTGDVLSEPVTMPQLAAVLAYPQVLLATRDVFVALGLSPGQQRRLPAAAPAVPRTRDALVEFLTSHPNDLEPAAIALAPVIAKVLATLRAMPDCRLARMSGSGSACFGLFASQRAAHRAARALSAVEPRWWVRATALGAPQ